MKTINALVFAATCIVMASPLSAIAQTPPTKHKGIVSVTGKAALPLGAQIPVMKGYQVQVRKVVVAPGGVVKAHDHSKRPGAYFVVRGSKVVEHRGSKKTVVKPGTAVLEDASVNHWITNEGSEAEFFVFDIVPIKK